MKANTDIEHLNGLEPYLRSKIKGQDHAIARVCSVLERGQLGLQPTDKPLGSFLFLGPTGVGKTELTLEASRFLFGPDSVVRFDMSEFQHHDSVKLFLGDESGRPGRLERVLNNRTGGILLFDEIEKAHHLIWDLFLQILDTARITQNDHHTHDLTNFYIVFTSNIGSQQLLRPTRLPFATLERAVYAEVYRTFRPELIGRFDEKIVFKPLSHKIQFEIAKLATTEELKRLHYLGFDLEVSATAIDLLIRKGFSKSLGAREMKRAVQRLIGDAICEATKAGTTGRGKRYLTSTDRNLKLEPRTKLGS